MDLSAEQEANLFKRFFGKEPGPAASEGGDDLFVVSEHREGDPEGVERIRVRCGGLAVELLPSKGMSVGEAWVNEKPFFWEPPLKHLPDPVHIGPLDEVRIGDQDIPGLGFIRGFCGGVEMLGLENWGMHYYDEEKKRQLPIHGDVSLRPAADVDTFLFDQGIVVRGSFITREGAGNMDIPWYDRGDPAFHVTKRLLADKSTPGFYIVDIIENRSNHPVIPDWGYHVQLRPQIGAVYMVPSRNVSMRGGGQVADDFDTWNLHESAGVRKERGYIHRDVLQHDNVLGGNPGVKTLLRYKDGTGIMTVIPPSPYLLSWFSAGGADLGEFLLPAPDGGPGDKIFDGAWNGVGPEIGASALDHDGNVDPAVPPVKPLRPGEKLELALHFVMIDCEGNKTIREQISEYKST